MRAEQRRTDSVERPDIRRRRAKIEAILEAATALFATDGYAETSLADVAAKVDLTPKALYYYYSSKHELLEAVLRQGFSYFDAEELTSARRKWSSLPLREALVESSIEAMANLLEHGGLLRVSFSETMHGSKTTQRRHEEYQDNWIDHVESIVRRQAGLGPTACHEFAEHLVALLFGTCVDVILRPRPSVARGFIPSRPYVESIVDHLLDGITWQGGPVREEG